MASYGASTIKEVKVADPEGLMLKFKATGDIELRNQLVMHYLQHVNVAIYSMRSILLSNVPFDDFFNQGILALIDCIERYDPSRGATFDTYCYLGIRGTIIKYLRKQNWLPNRVWENRKKINSARSELEQTLMREPTDLEIANYLELTPKQLSSYIVEISSADTVSFEEFVEQSYEVTVEKVENTYDNIDFNILGAEMNDQLANAIEKLSDKQKQIISLYYYEHLNLREISEVLDISQQRVSQIRKRALDTLQSELKAYHLD